MELALMWSGIAAAALLAVALAVAQAARWPGGRGTALLTVVLALLAVAFLPVGGLFYVCYFLRAGPGPQASPLLLAVPALPVGLCAAALVALGRRPAAPGLAPRAAAWPRARLGLSLLAVALVLGTSARNVLLSSQQRLESRRATLLGLERLWWPSVPAALNAAPLYAEAYKLLVPLDRLPGGHAAFEALWGSPSSTAQQAAAPVLAEWTRRNAAALALAYEGAALPGYASLEEGLWRGGAARGDREGRILRLEMGRAGHDANTVDNAVSRRRLGDLLQTRALQRAQAGQAALAVQDANALLALEEQTGARELAPERLIERLLGVPGMDAGALAALRFPRVDGLDLHLQRALLRAEADQLARLDLFVAGPPPPGPRGTDPLDTIFLPLVGVFRAEAWTAEVERAFDDLWEAIYAPPAERLARIRKAGSRAGEGPFVGPVRGGWIRDALEWRLHREARRAAAVAGVAVARHRLATGRWPESLEALVPGALARVPADPFDGRPLRYRAGPAAALVYSIGPDLKDDAGAPPSAGGDLVFTVHAAAR